MQTPEGISAALRLNDTTALLDKTVHEHSGEHEDHGSLEKIKHQSKKRVKELKRGIQAQVCFDSEAISLTEGVNGTDDARSKPYRRSKKPHSEKHLPRVKLETSMFNLPPGTKVHGDLFEKLSELHVQISDWLNAGRMVDERFGSRSNSRMVSSELDFLQQLDVTSRPENGTGEYEFLRQHRDTYVSLHRRGQHIQNTFKDIIALPSSKGKVRPLLDALMQVVDTASVHSSRAQRLNALLVRWCSHDSEKVRKALQERLEKAQKSRGYLPSAGDMRALKSLAPKEWLNDEIVNSALALLPVVDNVLMLDSFFFNLVSRKQWEHLPKHNALVRNGRKLVDRSWRRIIFPVNQMLNHWICVCIDFEVKTVTIYDSLSSNSLGESRTKILQDLRELIAFIANASPFDVSPDDWYFDPNYFAGAIQHNGYECGVYTILFALHLHGGDIDGEHVPRHLMIPHTQDDLNGFRLLILDMILG